MLTNKMLFTPLTKIDKNYIRSMIRAFDTSEPGIPNPNAFKERLLIKDLTHCLEFRCYDLYDFIRKHRLLVVVYQDIAYCKELEEYGVAIFAKRYIDGGAHNEKCIKLST